MRLVLNLVLVVSYFAVLMKSKLVCINDSFMCDNSCKPNFWLCDGVKDCADGRDESDCNPPQCNEHEFSCNTGKKTCLQNILMCNGQIDCPDGSDEDYCEKTSTNECDGDSNGKSDGSIFKCASNSKKCIPIKWRCDHHNDCSDGSDELNCSYTGKCEGKNMWTCADGKCIIKSKRCDGRMDCFDKSDELNCPAPLSSPPSSPLFSSHQRCFGDEGTSFVCTLSGECLRKEWVCDGAADCLDASDEDNCPTVSCNGTLMGVLQHSCANKLHCIDPRQVCDGIKQCRDGSDERDCKQECSIDEFSCSSLAKLKSSKAEIHESNDNIKDNIPKKDDGSDKDVSGNDERTELIRKDSCLSLSKMCDAVKDCANGEDEDEAICSSDQSEVCVLRNGGCSDECQSNKFFHRCLCPSGYKLSDDFKTCQDIDECTSSSSNTCAHLCANTPGSYTCSCHPGYILDNVDNATCIQIGVEAVMLFSTQDDIRRFSLHSGKYEPIVMDAINNLAFDFNVHDKTLYFVNPSLAGRKDELTRLVFDQNWNDLTLPALSSSPLISPPPPLYLSISPWSSPSSPSPLSSSSSPSSSSSSSSFPIEAVAIDWIHNNLYWTESADNSIGIMSLLAPNFPKNTLIYRSLDEPRAIVVDPRLKYRRLYWADWGRKPMIEMSYLDGSSRAAIVTASNFEISWPNGLTIDIQDNQLYWVDAKLNSINRYDVHLNKPFLVHQSAHLLTHPFSVAVFQDHIYWSDWTSHSIMKIKKNGPLQPVSIVNDVMYPKTIKIVHHYLQPHEPNECNLHDGSMRCSHICAPRLIGGRRPSYRCLCPADDVNTTYKMIDNYTCVAYNRSFDERQAFVKKVSREGKVNVVAVGACFVVLLLFATSFMIFTKVRRLYRQRQVKSMNFDNPVYKKSTGDDEYDDGNVAASAVAPAATSNSNNTTNNDNSDDSNNDNNNESNNNNGSNNNNVNDVNPVVVVLSYDGSHVTSNAESLTLIQNENM